MGANGAGKSTLVKILTGAVRPDAGTIAVRGRERTVHSPGEARRGGLVSVYQEPALIPDLDIRSNLRLTDTPVEPFRHWLGELGLDNLDLSSMARRVPLASLRIIDLARALAIEPDVLMLDEMTAALPANLTERVLSVVGRQKGGDRSIIFISHRMIEIAAVCDRATVLREGETVGRRRRDRGLGGPDRRADARPDRRPAAGGHRADDGPDAGGRHQAPPRRPRPRARDEAPGRLVRSVSRRGPGRRGARGPGAGRAVRHPRRRRPSERRGAAGGRLARLLPPSRRRHPGRARVRRRRPRRGAPDAALGPREHRPAVIDQSSALGSDRPPPRGDGGQRRGREAADRRARRWRGAPAVGWQPAEGDDRPLGRGRRAHDAVLRPDPRHRHRHEAADLRAAPRPGGGRGRRPALHVGAQGGPAGLRPGHRHLRRSRGRGDPGRRRGRAGLAPCGVQPQVGCGDPGAGRRRGDRRAAAGGRRGTAGRPRDAGTIGDGRANGAPEGHG